MNYLFAKNSSWFWLLKLFFPRSLFQIGKFAKRFKLFWNVFWTNCCVWLKKSNKDWDRWMVETSDTTYIHRFSRLFTPGQSLFVFIQGSANICVLWCNWDFLYSNWDIVYIVHYWGSEGLGQHWAPPSWPFIVAC